MSEHQAAAVLQAARRGNYAIQKERPEFQAVGTF